MWIRQLKAFGSLACDKHRPGLMRQRGWGLRPAVRRSLALGLGLLAASSTASAADFTVRISGRDGKPLSDIIVYVESAAAKPVGLITDIDQVNKEFVPYVSAVPVGSKIRFPNKDNIRHHVYSFSDPKKFELKLYSGVPAEPVPFDKPGVVALGCNIHDWMLAYVLVVDTPWFARSNEQGIAVLQLPPGPHQLQLWHPDLVQPFTARTITVSDQSPTLQLTAEVRPRLSMDKQYQ